MFNPINEGWKPTGHTVTFEGQLLAELSKEGQLLEWPVDEILTDSDYGVFATLEEIEVLEDLGLLGYNPEDEEA